MTKDPSHTDSENQQETGTKQVDLNAFSKKQLVQEIATDIDSQRQLLTLSKEDYEKAEDFEIKLFGVEEYDLFEEKELTALLVKFLPKHLLEEEQHIKGIAFHNSVRIPQVNKEGALVKEAELDTDKSNEVYIRTLCIKVHAEPLLNVYSPKGLHTDPEVLKLVILNAILHDFGHGIIDSYFTAYEEMSGTDNWQPVYQQIIALGTIFGFGTALTQKSEGYLVDRDAVLKATTQDEKAMLAIERAQEDFAEAIRLKALYPKKYRKVMDLPNNEKKEKFLEKTWKK